MDDKKQHKNSAARIKANAKYNAKTYKPFTVNAKIAEYEIIEAYCKAAGISKNKLVISAALYCIDHDIDPTRD